MSRVRATARSNIALSKYWGKSSHAGNVPAVPSLSVTLSSLVTTTDVEFASGARGDALTLDGVRVEGAGFEKAQRLFDEVRAHIGREGRFVASSHNDFPTASGLASSASGFAALALGAVRAAEAPLDDASVSRLARRASGSAARSVFGGFVELLGGEDEHDPAATQVRGPEHMPLRVLVAVTTELAKDTASTKGMELTAAKSPFYGAWLDVAPRIHRELRRAVERADLEATCELAERSALAMHASAMAAGIVYVSGATLAALREVHAMRREGLPAWATIDAGPHLKVLTSADALAVVTARVAAVPGVLRVITNAPGEGATWERVVE